MSLFYVFLSLGAALIGRIIAAILFGSSPLDNVRGPESLFRFITNVQKLGGFLGWQFMDELESYGSIALLHGLSGARILYVHDPTALHHILSKDVESFDTPLWLSETTRYVFGSALPALRGAEHRQERNVLGPLLSVGRLRPITPLFHEVATKLRNALQREVRAGSRTLDMYDMFSRTALETVGRAGLGYSFGLLAHADREPFAEGLKTFILDTGNFSFLALFSPWYKYLGTPSFRRKLVDLLPLPGLQAFVVLLGQLKNKSMNILADRRRDLMREKSKVSDSESRGDDLMSDFLRAQMQGTGFNDSEEASKITSLLFAGSDTIASSLAQLAALLAEHPDVQNRLRSEVRPATKDRELSYDELNALPYLDCVCRETLRLYPPTSFVWRRAFRDTTLPLAEPVLGKNGEILKDVTVPEGTEIVVAIRSANRNKAIWGEDAHEWRPERWLEPLPDGAGGHIMTFIEGPRSCIGGKFAELELKLVISTLISHFKLHRTAMQDVPWFCAGVTRYPIVSGGKEDKLRPSLPLEVEALAG